MSPKALWRFSLRDGGTGSVWGGSEGFWRGSGRFWGVHRGFRGLGKGGVFTYLLFFVAFSSVCWQPAAPGPVTGGGGRPPPPNWGHGVQTLPWCLPSSPGASAPLSPCRAGVEGIKDKPISPTPSKKTQSLSKPPIPSAPPGRHLHPPWLLLPPRWISPPLPPSPGHTETAQCPSPSLVQLRGRGGSCQVSFGGVCVSPQCAKQGGDPLLLTCQRLGVAPFQCLQVKRRSQSCQDLGLQLHPPRFRGVGVVGDLPAAAEKGGVRE